MLYILFYYFSVSIILKIVDRKRLVKKTGYSRYIIKHLFTYDLVADPGFSKDYLKKEINRESIAGI